MNILEERKHQRRLAFRDTLGFNDHDKYPLFGIEVEGSYLFITYFGEFFYLTPEFTGQLPVEERDVTKTPQVGRIEIGDRQASDFSEQESTVLRHKVEEIVAKSQAATASAKAKYEAEVRERLEDAKRNREAKACEHCVRINSLRSESLGFTRRVFKCTCGIRYVYDSQFRWWGRKTEAESEHEIQETLWVLRNGEPDYCG